MHHFSIPELVMRTGVIAPFSPNNVRSDVQVANVVKATTLPVGEQSTAIAQLAPSAGGPELPAVAPTVNGYEFEMGAADGVDILYGPLSNTMRYVVTAGAAAAVGAGVGAALAKRKRGKGAMYGALSGALTGIAALVVDSWARK